MLKSGMLLRSTKIERYYVATTGNDSTGDGTASAPWRSIDKALSTINIAGNAEIIVAAGTYAENTSGSGGLQLSRTFTNMVYVRPESGAAVTIQSNGTGGGYAILVATGAKNVRFSDVTIENNGDLYTILFANNGTGISKLWFTRCTISNNAAGGIAVLMLNNEADACRFDTCTVTASGSGNTAAMSVNGRAAGSQYVSNLSLVNCTMSGAQYALRLPNEGWVRDLLIDGGSYTATGLGTGAAIGLKGAAATGPMMNITLQGVTVGGNGRGINLGAAALSSPITNLQIVNCTVNTTANKQAGVLLGRAITGCLVSGGSYTGGETGTGYGGVYMSGPECTDLQVINATIASAAPDPVTNRVLALGVEGTDGVIVRGCSFSGDGRAIAIQDGTIDVLIEDCTSTAEDMFVRVGHDNTTAYSNHDVTVRNNTATSLLTAAVVVGVGAWNITVEDNVLAGGPSIFRFRGHATNDNIVVQRNTCSRNALFSGTESAALECFGMRNVQFLDNVVTSDLAAMIKLNLQDVLTNQNNTITGNTFNQAGDKVFDWATANDGNNNAVDSNVYRLTSGATVGDVRGTAGITTLAGLQAAWAGYTNATNDANSAVT